MKNNIKMGLGILTVLAVPFTLDATVGANEAQAAQGWVQSGSTWYYYNTQGQPVKNAWIGNYWLGADGKMAVNSWVDGGKYYVGSNGVWDKNAQKPAPKMGWQQNGTAWYYYNTLGQPIKNAWIDNYWLGADGKMAVNSWVDGGKYYVGSNGVWDKNAQKPAPKMGWQQNGTAWYYYNTQGQPVKNAWIGDYWLGADGKMTVNSWVDGGKYYVGSNGVWDKNAQKPEEKKTGWIQSGSAWYYYNTQGQPVKNVWIGNYWLGADGKMAVNSWVDNGRYYVDSSGAWVQNKGNSSTKNTSLDSILNIARNYLGVQSGSDEHKKIVDAYNSVNPKPVGYTAKYSDDWCDIFVTTVFQQAGLSDLIGRECGVQRHINIMEKKGIWKGKTLPKVGDVITFDWDGGGFADHIGIVESVNNGIVTTIEGNSSNYAGSTEETRVNRKTYNWNASYIKGYARPVY